MSFVHKDRFSHILRLWPESVFAVLCFLIPPFYHLWPVIGTWGTEILGVSGDVISAVWSVWHVAQAVFVQGEPLFWTDHLLAPAGTALHFHGLCTVPSIIVSPVTYFFSPMAGYHSLIVLCTLLAGLGPFLLVRRFTGSVPAASFAAFAAEMCPVFYHRIDQGHYTMAIMGTIALSAYLFLILVIERRVRRVTAAASLALFMFLIFITDYYHFIYVTVVQAALFMGFAVASAIRRDWSRLKRIFLDSAAAAALFGGLLYLFVLFSPFQNALLWNDQNPHPTAGSDLGVDVPWLFKPRPNMWLLSPDKSGTAAFPTNPEQTNYLGYLVLALAVLGCFRLAKTHTWASVTLSLLIVCCLLLSLGSILLINGKAVSFDSAWNKILLFNHFRDIPVISQARTPARWIFTTMSFLIVFSGVGLAFLSQLVGRRTALLLAVICAAVVALEYAHKPLKKYRYAYPEGYTRFIPKASHPLDYMIELPLGVVWGSGGVGGAHPNINRMIYATRHRHRTITAYLSKISDDRVSKLFTQPILRELLMMQQAPQATIPLTQQDKDQYSSWAKANRLKYIVVGRGSGSNVLGFINSLGIAKLIGEDQHDLFYEIQL